MLNPPKKETQMNDADKLACVVIALYCSVFIILCAIPQAIYGDSPVYQFIDSIPKETFPELVQRILGGK